MMWEKDIETMPRKEIQRLQLERLKNVVRRCYQNVPYYHQKLDAAGVDPDRIKTLSDVQYLPFTTKTDIRDTYPYGLFAVPMRDIVRIHASSGTTGKPTVVGYTKNDLDTWSTLIARLTTAAGATADDIVQISFGYGLFTGALGLHYGLEKIGASVIPISSGNTEKQLMVMKDFGVTALLPLLPMPCIWENPRGKWDISQRTLSCGSVCSARRVVPKRCGVRLKMCGISLLPIIMA